MPIIQTLKKWYDKAVLLSYALFFNICIGNRGVGKTYSFKRWCIDDFIKTGKQFVWVRRFGTEIEMMRKSFFDDVRDCYPDVKFEVKGNKKSGTFIIDGKVAGYYFALSTSSIAKSSSYPLVDKIIFDEFLIVGNTYKYLTDEVVLLLELIDTIFRDRETKVGAIKPRGVYLLGNNITISNPYFLYFNIPQIKNRFYVDKTRGILVEMYKNEVFIEEKKTTRFGALISGTAYYDYNVENKAMLDNDKFIRHRPSHCNFHCAIDYKGRTVGFWFDYKNGEMYATNQYDPDTYARYCLTKDDHDINLYLVKNCNNTAIKTIVWCFRAGLLFFDDQYIKNQCYEMLSYFVR